MLTKKSGSIDISIELESFIVIPLVVFVARHYPILGQSFLWLCRFPPKFSADSGFDCGHPQGWRLNRHKNDRETWLELPGVGDGAGVGAVDGAGAKETGRVSRRERDRSGEPGDGGDQAGQVGAVPIGETEAAGVSVAISWLLTGRSRRPGSCGMHTGKQDGFWPSLLNLRTLKSRPVESRSIKTFSSTLSLSASFVRTLMGARSSN